MEQLMEEDFSIEDEYNKIKIMLIGDSTVGKTSLIRKYCENEFSETYITTVGIDFQIKYLDINNKKIKLQIWDTAGQERYQTVAKNYFNSSNGFIIVYDIAQRSTFDSVYNWVEQIKELAPSHIKIVIFGNKTDLNSNRVIKIKEGKELGEKFNFKFFETSAKTGQNLNEGFEYLVKEILGDIDPVKRSRKEGKKLINKNQKDKKSSCC